MRRGRLFGLALAGCAMGLCVGCGGATIQHQRVAMVKSAAIVGMGASLNIENRTQGSGAATLGAAQEMGNLGSDETIAERAEQGKKLYDTLGAALNKSMGWSVKSLDDVASDAANKALFEEKIGEPNALQLGGKRIYTPGILWTERVRGLESSERKKLFDTLGVDALVFADINYYVGKTGPVTWKAGGDGVVTVTGPIPGTSAAYPAARISLQVFDATSPEPIWTGSAGGEPATLGVVTSMGIEHKTDLVPILQQAADSAWTALYQGYETSKAEAASAAAAAPQG